MVEVLVLMEVLVEMVVYPPSRVVVLGVGHAAAALRRRDKDTPNNNSASLTVPMECCATTTAPSLTATPTDDKRLPSLLLLSQTQTTQQATQYTTSDPDPRECCCCCILVGCGGVVCDGDRHVQGGVPLRHSFDPHCTIHSFDVVFESRSARFVDAVTFWIITTLLRLVAFVLNLKPRSENT
jgi:hypothetical protein